MTRLLGVDFGTVRVGLAITDPDRKIASPLATYERRGVGPDGEYFKKLVKEEAVGGLIVGLPTHNDGREGQKAAEARAFGAWLEQQTGLPVAFWDERFTTVEAEGYLLSAGLTSKRRKARRDRIAAQIMLQCYLEANPPSKSGEPDRSP